MFIKINWVIGFLIFRPTKNNKKQKELFSILYAENSIFIKYGPNNFYIKSSNVILNIIQIHYHVEIKISSIDKFKFIYSLYMYI